MCHALGAAYWPPAEAVRIWRTSLPVAHTPLRPPRTLRSVNVTDPLFSSYSAWKPVRLCYFNCSTGVNATCPQTPLAAITSVPPPAPDQCGGCAGNYDVTNVVTLIASTTGRVVGSANATTVLTCGSCSAIVTLNGTTTRVWSWCEAMLVGGGQIACTPAIVRARARSCTLAVHRFECSEVLDLADPCVCWMSPVAALLSMQGLECLREQPKHIQRRDTV